MCDHGIGLFFWVILTKRNKIDIFGVQKKADIFHIHSQCIVGGDRDKQRFFVPQMSLGCHEGGSICDAVGKFCYGIACAGENHQFLYSTAGRTDKILPVEKQAVGGSGFPVTV